MIRFSIYVIMTFFLIACGGNTKPENNNTVNSSEQKITKNETNEKISSTSININEDIMKSGKEVYENYCLMCHQTDGTGVPSTFPPLTGTKHVLGSKEKLIDLVLNGQKGEIEVLGEIYDGEMPAQDFLTNKQIADVLTYVRNSFDNSATAITPSDVESLRNN